MDKELKPCPFCGAKAKLKVKAHCFMVREKKYGTEIEMSCTECGVSFDRVFEGLDLEKCMKQAAKYWNRRANNG